MEKAQTKILNAPSDIFHIYSIISGKINSYEILNHMASLNISIYSACQVRKSTISLSTARYAFLKMPWKFSSSLWYHNRLFVLAQVLFNQMYVVLLRYLNGIDSAFRYTKCSCRLKMSNFCDRVFCESKSDTHKSTTRMNSCREIMNRCVHMTNVAQLKCANMHIFTGCRKFWFCKGKYIFQKTFSINV